VLLAAGARAAAAIESNGGKKRERGKKTITRTRDLKYGLASSRAFDCFAGLALCSRHYTRRQIHKGQGGGPFCRILSPERAIVASEFAGNFLIVANRRPIRMPGLSDAGFQIVL